MKIIKGDKVYIQKDDIAYLKKNNFYLPDSIVLKGFEDGIIFICPANRLDFIEITAKEDVDFLKSCDWMIDYNEVKDLTGEEFVKLAEEIRHERSQTAKQISAIDSNGKPIVTECRLLDFKMNFLKEILLFKQGQIKMNLPEGVEYPCAYEVGKKTTPVRKNGVKHLIKTIFNRKTSE